MIIFACNINQSLRTSGPLSDNLKQRDGIMLSLLSTQRRCPACKVALKRINYSYGLRSLSCLSSIIHDIFSAGSETTTTPTTSANHDLSGEETSSIGL